ncbi:MAG: tetratricopeptide (TPR) repeat protein/class 3 adenylate cyclase [Saprospiraceae bacterium]
MSNLIPHFIQEQYRLNEKKGRFRAYTMFIDISGFTPLTQSLMKEGNAGAEKLSQSLNQIFSPMVALVYSHNGFIPYFAGDAFTAVFPKKESSISPEEFLFAAQQIRDLFSKEKLKKTVLDGFEIGIKVGLSYGQVDWGIVGKERKGFYFRGRGIDDCANCEHYAEGGDIVFDKKIMQRLDVAKMDGVAEEIESGFFKLVKRIKSATNTSQKTNLPNLAKVVLKKFLPESVIDIDQHGEFRNVISVFCKFEGVSTHKRLNKFATIVLEEVNRFSGYFKEIDFGDKGGILLGFFGAPVSFENNIERALECVLSIQDRVLEINTAWGLKYRVGITSGLAFTGIVGGKERCQYAAVGNWVNLAARLMITAEWGTVLVDENIQKHRNYIFNHIGDSKYKGIEGNIPTYALISRNIEDKAVFTGDMIGRAKELKRLLKFASGIFQGTFAGIYYIYGDAGIGKTRLTFELKRKLWEVGTPTWFTCQADQILKKPLNPFVYFLKTYFEQSTQKTISENIKDFDRRFDWLTKDVGKVDHPNADNIQKELLRTKSIIAAQITIFYPNSLWEQLDAKGRYENTLMAFENIFKAESLIRPLVIELEDAHWFDDDSKAFLQRFARSIGDFPIFLLATSRYNDDGSKPKLLDESTLTRYQVPTQEEDLNILSKGSLRKFAEVWMKGTVHEEVVEMLYKITNGNPFYAEQILEYLSETNMLHQVDNLWNIKDKNVHITSSINSILMARIDRLSSLAKETVKAAAVIGREFEVPVLTEVMKGNHAFMERNGNSGLVLKQQIQTAEQGQIWRAMNDLRYIFKHSLLREAVYQMQLTTRLQELHNLIATAIEKIYKDSIEERYVDLAFHFGQAKIEDKTNNYLEKAADHARRNYQNQQALDFYNTLLRNLEGINDQKAEIRVLLKKGIILQLIGKWDESEEVCKTTLQIAKDLGDGLLLGRALNNLGQMLILKGEYENAKNALEEASRYFNSFDDKYGILNVLGNLGNLNLRQGEYDKAKEFFIESIALSKDLKETNTVPQITSNLGLTYMNLGNYDAGIQCQLEWLEVCEASNDKQGMATLNTNVGIVYYEKGDYDAALHHYKKGLALSEELGNKFLTSIAIGCIGSVYQKKGDFQMAMDHFIRDLELAEELGDKQGLSIAIGLIGELHSVEGEFDIAIQYLQKTLDLSEELSYQKGIAKTVNNLADIYRLQGIHTKAIEYYDRAISISKKINNRLVLCASLIEKGEVLIAQKSYAEAEIVNQETMPLAKELGNPDILFDASLYSLVVAHHTGNPSTLGLSFEDLLESARGDEDQAAIYYELYKIHQKETTYGQKAFELYQELFASSPQFRFKSRLKELKSAVRGEE